MLQILDAAYLPTAGLLLFLLVTDVSIAGLIPNLLFNLVTGGFLVLYPIDRGIKNKAVNMLAGLVRRISIIAAGLTLMPAFAIVVPPVTFGAILFLHEFADETQIQQIESPDGRWEAHVYFRGVGPYTGGNGRTYVRVRNVWIPFLEREVFYLSKSYTTGGPSDYISWVDSTTLLISETQEQIPVDRVGFEIPFPIRVPLMLVELFVHLSS